MAGAVERLKLSTPGSDFVGAAAAATVISSGDASSSLSDLSDSGQPSFGTQLTAALRASAKGQASSAGQPAVSTSVPVQPAKATSSRDGKSGKKQQDSDGKHDPSTADGTADPALTTAVAVAGQLPVAIQQVEKLPDPTTATSARSSASVNSHEPAESAQTESAKLAATANSRALPAHAQDDERPPVAAPLPTGNAGPPTAKRPQPAVAQGSKTQTSTGSDSDANSKTSGTAYAQPADASEVNPRVTAAAASTRPVQSLGGATALPAAGAAHAADTATKQQDTSAAAPADSTNAATPVAGNKPGAQADVDADQDDQDLGTATPSAAVGAQPKPSTGVADPASGFSAALAQASAQATGGAAHSSSAPAAATPPTNPQAPLPAEQVFMADNHGKIVDTIGGQLVPGGGTMRLTLDPPQLGALRITVQMHEGVMNASFETSNDQATRMLGHSLTDLKAALETQGISVGKLEVRQSSTDSGSRQGDSKQSPTGEAALQQEEQAQQERQRKEMLQRMWERVSIGSDDLDMVA